MLLGCFLGCPCDRTGSLGHEGRGGEDKRKAEYEMSRLSHGAPTFGRRRPPLAKRSLFCSSNLRESMLCRYAETAGEREWQLWRRGHSVPINNQATGQPADFA